MGKKVMEENIPNAPVLPLIAEWVLPCGRSSGDAPPSPMVPFPAEVGQAKLDYLRLGEDGSGIFSLKGQWHSPMIVKSTVLVDEPILSVRITASGRTRFERIGTSPLEESSERFTLNCVVDSRSLIYHQPGEVNDVLVPFVTVSRLRAMMVGCRVSVPIQRLLDGSNVNTSTLARTSPTMHRIAALIKVNPYQGGMATLYAQGKVFELLAEVLTNLAGIEEPVGRTLSLDRQRAMTARDMIMSDLLNPPSAEELASRFGLSQHRLNEVFRELFDAPVLSCIAHWRLDLARDLLREGHMSVKEIAFHLGYAHVSSFSAAFTRQFGVAPASYRRSVISSFAVPGDFA
ncbi:HTH araC/xylS-type domain-containing protein [uncultured Gammaproteobacteria bacterium]